MERFAINQSVTDGYFAYRVVFDNGGELVDVVLCGHSFRIPRTSLRPN